MSSLNIHLSLFLEPKVHFG